MPLLGPGNHAVGTLKNQSHFRLKTPSGIAQTKTTATIVKTQHLAKKFDRLETKTLVYNQSTSVHGHDLDIAVW